MTISPSLIRGRQFGGIFINHFATSDNAKPGQLDEIERILPSLINDHLSANGRVVLLGPLGLLEAQDKVTFRDQISSHFQVDAIMDLAVERQAYGRADRASLLLLQRPKEKLTLRATVLAPGDLQVGYHPDKLLAAVRQQLESKDPPKEETMVFERPTLELGERWDPKFHSPARQKLQDRLIGNANVSWLDGVTEFIAQGIGPDNFIPFMRTRLSGTTKEAHQKSIAGLRVGDMVLLRRDSDNPHDATAIKVERRSGAFLGYLPTELATEIAPQLEHLEEAHAAAVVRLHGKAEDQTELGVTIEFAPLRDPASDERRIVIFEPGMDVGQIPLGLRQASRGTYYGQPITLVRARDIINNKLEGTGERVLLSLNNPYLADSKRERWDAERVRIKKNDILLQLKQPDKACVVTSSFEGAVCDDELAIIRPAQDIDPLFLLSYIVGSDFQQQLAYVSRSNGHQYVALDDLRELLVVIPSLSTQRRVAMAFAESQGQLGAEAASGLAESLRLAYEPGTVEVEWLASSVLSSLTAYAEQIDTLDEWLRLKGSFVQQLRNAVAHGRFNVNDQNLLNAILALDRFRVVTTKLSDSAPYAGGEMSNAQQLLNDFDQQTVAIANDYIRGQFLTLSRFLQGLLQKGITATSLDVELESTILPPDILSDLRVRLTNPGSEVVSNVELIPTLSSGEIIERPDWVVDALAPEESFPFEARVRFRMPGTVRLNCTAYFTVAGVARNERMPTQRLEVVPVDQLPFEPIRPNPYITGGAVESSEMFFGREDVLASLRDNLFGKHQTNVIILQGNRRTGKTSILKQIVVRDWFAPHIPVFIDAQGLGTLSNQLFYYKLANEIWKTLRKREDVETPPRISRDDISEEDPFYDFREHLEDLIPTDRHIVLLIDEFEVIDMAIKAKLLDPFVLENLRSLFQHNSNVAVILTGSYRLSTLSEDYWSILFGLGQKHDIGFLDEYSARQLITEPLRDLVSFTDDAVNRIIELTSCQPLYVQMVCHNIVNLLNSQRSNFVTLNTVEDAAQETLTSASEQIRHMFTGTESLSMQAILVFIANQLSDPDGSVSLIEIERFINEHQLPITSSQLTVDLREMEQRDLLSISGIMEKRRYRFKIDLFRQWLRRNQDLQTAVAKVRETI